MTTKITLEFRTEDDALTADYGFSQGVSVFTEVTDTTITISADKQREQDSPEDFEGLIEEYKDLMAFPADYAVDGQDYADMIGLAKIRVDQEGAVTEKSFV